MSEILNPIWQRVLQRPQVGAHDNFFDLGGDSASAGKLFAEIAQVSGRELPPETILQSPTIAGLAAFLEGADSPRIPRIIPLRGGAKESAVFLTHGIGGSVLELSRVVHHIETDHPIYGLQARGMDGLDEPHNRIEDMALYFLEAIREKQPQGPYILIGYSMGGLVTLDIARRLFEMGEKIALLVMIEAYPGRRFQPLGQRMGIYSRLLKKHASNMRQLPLPRAISYILRPSERFEQRSGEEVGKKSGQRLLPRAQIADMVSAAGYQALDHYRPHFYPGKIRFVKSEISLDFPDDAIAVWSKLAADVTIETAPGDHQGIIGAHAESLGPVLSRYLQEAACQK